MHEVLQLVLVHNLGALGGRDLLEEVLVEELLNVAEVHQF